MTIFSSNDIFRAYFCSECGEYFYFSCSNCGEICHNCECEMPGKVFNQKDFDEWKEKHKHETA